MTVTIEVPKPIEEALRRGLGAELGQTARIGFAVEAYRSGKLSLGQLAQMLGLSADEADNLLKDRGVMLEIDEAELEREVESLRGMIGR